MERKIVGNPVNVDFKNRYSKAISRLARELMYCLKSPKYGNYIKYCRSYAKAMLENDLYYDEYKDRWFSDGGDDVVEVSKFFTKTGNPATIDVSDI